MKHLKLFQTEAEYNSATLELPNVSFIEETKVVNYTPDSSSSSDYVMVDLGLPSGLLWADRNIGAESPEDYGLYFQWGDTVGYTGEQVTNGEKKFASDWSDCFDTTKGGYTFNKYTSNKLTVLEASDDAATVNMGSDWRMPTYAELTELINNTTATFIDLDGNEFSQSETRNGAIAEYNLKGIKLTSKANSNSVFIPAAGNGRDAVLGSMNYSGCLWSSDLYTLDIQRARSLGFNCNGYLSTDYNNRYYGRSVRGVSN